MRKRDGRTDVAHLSFTLRLEKLVCWGNEAGARQRRGQAVPVFSGVPPQQSLLSGQPGRGSSWASLGCPNYCQEVTEWRAWGPVQGADTAVCSVILDRTEDDVTRGPAACWRQTITSQHRSTSEPEEWAWIQPSLGKASRALGHPVRRGLFFQSPSTR